MAEQLRRRTRKRRESPARLAPTGECADCSVLAGPGYLVSRLDGDGRCPSCAYYFDKYGPPLSQLESDRLALSRDEERGRN
jgi:hypothetical protein